MPLPQPHPLTGREWARRPPSQPHAIETAMVRISSRPALALPSSRAASPLCSGVGMSPANTPPGLRVGQWCRAQPGELDVVGLVPARRAAGV